MIPHAYSQETRLVHVRAHKVPMTSSKQVVVTHMLTVCLEHANFATAYFLSYAALAARTLMINSVLAVSRNDASVSQRGQSIRLFGGGIAHWRPRLWDAL